MEDRIKRFVRSSGTSKGEAKETVTRWKGARHDRQMGKKEGGEEGGDERERKREPVFSLIAGRGSLLFHEDIP